MSLIIEFNSALLPRYSGGDRMKMPPIPMVVSRDKSDTDFLQLVKVAILFSRFLQPGVSSGSIEPGGAARGVLRAKYIRVAVVVAASACTHARLVVEACGGTGAELRQHGLFARGRTPCVRVTPSTQLLYTRRTEITMSMRDGS